MRFRREREGLLTRVRAGEETIRHIAGRFFIKRLTNIGATGYQRSWTDNILWHHFCHFVDLGLFLFDGEPIRRVEGYLGRCHERTGIPMECVVLVETEADQSLLVHGSYHATYRFYDKLIVTDRETYFYDILAGTLRTAEGTRPIEAEQENAARIIDDFLDAVRNGRPPLASGPSVLPAMGRLPGGGGAGGGGRGARAPPGGARTPPPRGPPAGPRGGASAAAGAPAPPAWRPARRNPRAPSGAACSWTWLR
jgi:2-hydroxy-4-carboxymuconate semialdehyde hemiacetal dehydrogenase